MSALTNFPDGAASYGVPVLPRRYFKKVLWVGNTSGLPSGTGKSPTSPLSSLFGAGGALAKAHATLGTLINVLPGHAENVSAADMASDTGAAVDITIRGIGEGTRRPKLTWTVTGSSWLFDTVGIQLENFILQFAGDPALTAALTVTAPITISAASCAIRDCTIHCGFDADQLSTIGITTTAGATDLVLERNLLWGATTSEVTTMVKIVGTDRLVMRDNVLSGATAATTTGVLTFATTASLHIRLERNTYINRKALSTCSVVGLAGVSGVSKDEHFAYLDTTSMTPWLTSTGIMTFHRPTVTNTAGETGTEVVGTVSAAS